MSDDAADWRTPPPDDSRNVLVWVSYMSCWFIGHFNHTEDRFYLNDFSGEEKQKLYFTHWHELPKDPK